MFADDELSYEDFDDMSWAEPADDDNAIDLDALDNEINAPEDSAPAIEAPPKKPVSRPPSPPAATDEADEPEKVEAVTAPPKKPASRPPSRKPSPPPVEPTPTAEKKPAPAAKDTPKPKAKAAAEPEPAIETTTESEPEAKPAEKPKSKAPAAEKKPAPAAKPEAKAVAEQVDEPEPEPEPPDEVFCVLLELTSELDAQVLTLRNTGEITTMPPPGVVLTSAFRAAEMPKLERALAEWTRAHLPLQIEVADIHAEVSGAQQYIAAWNLDPAEELQEAQFELKRALAECTTPANDIASPASSFHVSIVIGDHIPARRYPQVIGQMQRVFQPYVWHVHRLQLVRLQPEVAPNTWEMVKSFD